MSRVVFIVEGYKDEDQVKGALGDVDCIVTGGTKLDNRIKGYIDFYIDKGYDIYLLSDPDDAGDHLEQMINEHYNIPRIHADFEECKYCKDLYKQRYKAGIEYSSYKYLRELLEPYVNKGK